MEILQIPNSSIGICSNPRSDRVVSCHGYYYSGWSETSQGVRRSPHSVAEDAFHGAHKPCQHGPFWDRPTISRTARILQCVCQPTPLTIPYLGLPNRLSIQFNYIIILKNFNARRTNNYYFKNLIDHYEHLRTIN